MPSTNPNRKHTVVEAVALLSAKYEVAMTSARAETSGPANRLSQATEAWGHANALALLTGSPEWANNRRLAADLRSRVMVEVSQAVRKGDRAQTGITGMTEARDKLVNALLVLLMSPEIRPAIDPMALTQAETAIREGARAGDWMAYSQFLDRQPPAKRAGDLKVEVMGIMRQLQPVRFPATSTGPARVGFDTTDLSNTAQRILELLLPTAAVASHEPSFVRHLPEDVQAEVREFLSDSDA